MTANNKIHECSESAQELSGVGDWDYVVDSEDLGERFAIVAAYRILHGFSNVQMSLSHNAFDFAKQFIPADRLDEYWKMWATADDLGVTIAQSTARIAARITRSLPRPHSSIEGMLQEAMVTGGLCCQEKIQEFLSDDIPSHMVDKMIEAVPAIKREMLLPESDHTTVMEALKLVTE